MLLCGWGNYGDCGYCGNSFFAMVTVVQVGSPAVTREWSNAGLSHQAEGAQDGQPLDVGQAQLHQAHGHDDAVEDVPAHLEVVVGVHGDQLEEHLGREDPSEHLDKKRSPTEAGTHEQPQPYTWTHDLPKTPCAQQYNTYINMNHHNPLQHMNNRDNCEYMNNRGK